MKVVAYPLSAAVAFLLNASAYGMDYDYWPAVQAALSGSELEQKCQADGYSSVELCLASRFAPQYRFHKEETHWPSTVEWYLERVRLRFSQDGGCHDGSNVIGPGRVRSELLPEQYVELRDRNWKAIGVVCKDTGHHMPSDRQYAGRHGFFLQVIERLQDETYAGMRPTGNPLQAPDWTVYAHVVAQLDFETGGSIGYEIQYWMFFPRDNGPVDWHGNSLGGDIIGGHEGDWEHISVQADEKGRVESLYYAQHEGGETYDPSDVFWANAEGEYSRPQSGIEPGSYGPDDEFTHPVVLVGLSKHASHPRPGTYPAPHGTSDHVQNNGLFWNSVGSITLLPERWENRPGFEWVRFAGHWGEIGVLKSSSGPTGPAIKGEYCKRKREEEKVPSCLPPCPDNLEPQDAWVILYKDDGWRAAQELVWFTDQTDRNRFSDYRKISFNDEVNSVRWCLPSNLQYQLYMDPDFGGRRLILQGNDAIQELWTLRGSQGQSYVDKVSSSRFFDSQ